MSITKEQAEKLRKLHVKHVNTAKNLAVDESILLEVPDNDNLRELVDKKRVAWRKAHTEFYNYVNELETA